MGVAVPGTACPGFDVSVATVSVDGAVVVEEDKTLVSVLTVVIGTGVDLQKKYNKRSVNKHLKAVFQLRVFYTYVHARKSLNHFNIAFEVNKCFDGENSAFSMI